MIRPDLCCFIHNDDIPSTGEELDNCLGRVVGLTDNYDQLFKVALGCLDIGFVRSALPQAPVCPDRVWHQQS